MKKKKKKKKKRNYTKKIELSRPQQANLNVEKAIALETQTKMVQ